MNLYTIFVISIVTVNTAFSANVSEGQNAVQCSTFENNIDNSEEQIERGITCYKTKNYSEAHKWFEAAGEHDESGWAFFYLGVMYAKGWGVAQDDTEATRLYRRAAYKGLAEAQYNYGVQLLNGTGTRKDEREAARFIHLATTQGLPMAMQLFGMLFLEGRGVPLNYTQAFVWLTMAYMEGYKPEISEKYLEWLVSNMTLSELRIARGITAAIRNTSIGEIPW